MSKTDKGWTEAELLRDLQRVADELGRGPTLKEYGQKGQYPKDRFYTVFGSWTAAKQQADLNPDARPNAGIDDDALLADIAAVADELGRSPASSEYKERGEHSLKPVYNRFDSWKEALKEAGLEVLNFESISQKVGENKLLETLRKDISEIGHVPTRDEYNKKGTYTDTTFANYFGSWNDALRKAGFEVNKRNDTRKEIECAGCGDIIQAPRWKRESREVLFCSRECQFKAKSFDAICANCGEQTKTTYIAAKRQGNNFCNDECRYSYYREHPPNSELYDCDNCGKEIEVNSWLRRKGSDHQFCSKDCSAEYFTISKEQLISDYKKIYNKIGCHPGIDEISEYGNHGVDTYYKNFDTLNDVADAAGIPKKSQTTETVNCENCNSEISKPVSRVTDSRDFCDRECYFEWMRDGNLRDSSIERPPNYGPNWLQQRRKAMERDNNTCQSCGMSSKAHKDMCGMDLHVHHITPWHEFDDYERRNKLSNLITLCAACHHKWESMPIQPQVTGGDE